MRNAGDFSQCLGSQLLSRESILWPQALLLLRARVVTTCSQSFTLRRLQIKDGYFQGFRMEEQFECTAGIFPYRPS